MITILYIDDEDNEIRKLKRNFKGSFKVESLTVKHNTSLDTILSRLDDNDFNYLIVDYNLNEKTGCGFEGGAILAAYLSKYPHFPSMVLTSFEPAALNEIKNVDVEKIRGKIEYHNSTTREAFIKRVEAKVEQYQDDIHNAEQSILELKKVADDRELTANEAQTYIEKDRFLQETLGANTLNIPSDVIYQDGKKLDTLLRETEVLIGLIQQNEKLS